mmetsp:Transcript_63677/g.183153  ORF Transcript_63677/g.183153 Transcript_63677/m.183153 type:complete len:300 (+) Transcript_63677:66-965(+)
METFVRASCGQCGQIVWVPPLRAAAAASGDSAPCRRCALQLGPPVPRSEARRHVESKRERIARTASEVESDSDSETHSDGAWGEQRVHSETDSERQSVPSTCAICLDTMQDAVKYTDVSNESWSNQLERCNHQFCRECLQQYISFKLWDGAWSIRCPGERCAYRLLGADISNILCGGEVEREGNASLFQKYLDLRSADHGARLKEMMAKSDDAPAEDDDDCKWVQEECQACPNCRVIVRKEDGCDHVECRCGAGFCFGCGAPQDEDSDCCICEEVDEDETLELEVKHRLGAWLLINKRL